jgi:hypothetical protein
MTPFLILIVLCLVVFLFGNSEKEALSVDERHRFIIGVDSNDRRLAGDG